MYVFFSESTRLLGTYVLSMESSWTSSSFNPFCRLMLEWKIRMGYHRTTASCCGELLLATYLSIRFEQLSEDNILGSPHQRMQLTMNNLKLCLLCTYFEATCKDDFEMFFNNGIVIEVLLFPKQFLIVLGLVSDDTQSPASLAKKGSNLAIVWKPNYIKGYDS